MGLFRKKAEPSEPVRADQVGRLDAAFSARDDAVLFDAPGNRDYARAEARLDAVLRNSSQAEVRAARPGTTG